MLATFVLRTDKQTDLFKRCWLNSLFWEQTNRQTYSKDVKQTFVLRTDKQTDLFKRCWLNVCFENRQTDRPIQKMLSKCLFWEQTNRQTYSKDVGNVCFENRQTDRPIQKMLATFVLRTDKQTDLFKRCWQRLFWEQTNWQTYSKDVELNVCFENRQTDRPIQKMLAKRLFWEQTNWQTYSKDVKQTFVLRTDKQTDLFKRCWQTFVLRTDKQTDLFKRCWQRLFWEQTNRQTYSKDVG